MNIADAKQQIKDTVDGYLAQDETGAYLIPTQAQRPLFLLGTPSIGKTAIVSQVASELGIGLVSYSMTHHTRQSALELPFIVHREYDGVPFDVSEYTMSAIIAAVYDYQEATGLKRGILFLDEINCVSETLYPSMLQFLQFKTFGRHKVPEGWIVVCAGNLIDQFLQDEVIAERFAQYYLLFTKYRSDYQVSSILEGRTSQDICERAHAARFDERLALLRLMLDALEVALGEANEKEAVVARVRDALRERKTSILAGARAEDAHGGDADELEQAAMRAETLESVPAAELRPQRLAAARLRELAAICARERCEAGAEAFAVMQEQYSSDVAALHETANRGSAQLQAAFDFITSVFGDGREMTAFAAELTVRPQASQFISMFGCDAYYAHNDGVVAGGAQADLAARMAVLDLDAARAAAEEAAAASVATAKCGGCHGC